MPYTSLGFFRYKIRIYNGLKNNIAQLEWTSRLPIMRHWYLGHWLTLLINHCSGGFGSWNIKVLSAFTYFCWPLGCRQSERSIFKSDVHFIIWRGCLTPRDGESETSNELTFSSNTELVYFGALNFQMKMSWSL